MKKYFLMGLCLGVLLIGPNGVLADCDDLGGFTSFSLSGSNTVTLYAGPKAISRFDVQSCPVQSGSTIRLMKTQVCDGDEILIDGTRCTVMNVQSLD
jgi:hypothetical protein